MTSRIGLKANILGIEEVAEMPWLSKLSANFTSARFCGLPSGETGGFFVFLSTLCLLRCNALARSSHSLGAELKEGRSCTITVQ